MNPDKITVEWLKKQEELGKFKIHSIYKPPTIEGVVLKELEETLVIQDL